MLKPGLYEQVINKQLDRELSRSENILTRTGKLDNAEAPHILSNYIGELVEKGLRQVSGGDIPAQFSLANGINHRIPIGIIGWLRILLKY